MSRLIKILSACEDGANYAEACGSYESAWNECERGDLMLRTAKRRNIDIRKLTKAKVECAKLVEHLMKDERSINLLRIAERFCEGNATRRELDAAADAASDAATAATAATATYAADVATYATYSATYDAAAYAATYDAAAYAAAAYAATYAADADAAAADAADTRKDILSKSADICRKYIQFSDLRMDEL